MSNQITKLEDDHQHEPFVCVDAAWHLEEVEAARADAYDRGFKDASALAANSVRQAREETWREAARKIRDLQHGIAGEPLSFDGQRLRSGGYETVAEEFERRAAMNEPK